MLNPLLRRGIRGVTCLLLASSTLAGVAIGLTTAAAHANSLPPANTGYVEICKVLNAAPAGVNINMNASFNYKVSEGDIDGDNDGDIPWTGWYSVAAGTCSNEIPVWANSSGTTGVTITETQAPWYKVSSITELAGQSYMGDPNLTTGAVTVQVTPSANVDTVTYTNTPVTGYIEVCKVAAANSGLTGNYAFTVTGADGFSNSTTAAAVGVNNCSNPIIAPAGTATVTEGGTNLYVTGISANLNGNSSMNAITNTEGNPNLTTGTVMVNVVPSTDTSNQTDVTYTNDVVAFKLCKTWDTNTWEPGGSSTSFPFSLSTSGPAGPNTLTVSSVSLLAGQCQLLGELRPGTQVTVTEGIVPGTKVESITGTGAESLGTPSLPTRSVTVTVGTPTSSNGLATNEAIVTFQNEAAAPGELKICKLAGAVPPVGNVFNFTVSGVAGTTSVNLGNCAVVGGPLTPTMFPYNSTVTVTELASASNAASAITTSPTYVTLNGVPNTAETVLSGTPNLGGTDTTSSVSVVIGEGDTTEVDFTDVDPPATVSNPVTVPIPGDSNLGVTTGPGVAVATVVASSPAVTTAAATIAVANAAVTESVANTAVIQTVANASGTTSGNRLTPAQKRSLLKRERAMLKHDRALLKSVNSRIASERRVVAHTKGAAHRAALKALTALRARQHVLLVESHVLMLEINIL